MNERLIFGCDPGGTQQKYSNSVRGTGWCLISVKGGHAPRLIAHGLVPGGPTEWLAAIHRYNEPDELYRALRDATEAVVEGFTLLNAKANISPLEIVGMMRMYGAMAGIPVYVSRPGERTAVDHDDLKRIGWWPGGAGHADEAQSIRHVLSKLLREGHVGTAAMIVPMPDKEEAPSPDSASSHLPSTGTGPQVNDLW